MTDEKQHKLLKMRQTERRCQRCDNDKLFYFYLGLASMEERDINILKEATHTNYLPPVLGLSDGRYIECYVCRQCGQMQGEWPAPDPVITSEDT